jgi:hypothetical protein
MDAAACAVRAQVEIASRVSQAAKAAKVADGARCGGPTDTSIGGMTVHAMPFVRLRNPAARGIWLKRERRSAGRLERLYSKSVAEVVPSEQWP